MPGIRLYIVSEPPPDSERLPGAMWRYPDGDEGGRECWWIVLPNTKPQAAGYASEISWRTTDRASSPPHEMWEVVGTPPLITVSPSIDVECWRTVDGQTVRDGSYWHGFITNGEMTPA